MASDEASGLDRGKRVSEETVASMEAEPQRRQVAADAASKMKELD